MIGRILLLFNKGEIATHHLSNSVVLCAQEEPLPKALEAAKAKPAATYCTCSKPHGGKFMIACDDGKAEGCKEWYHGECVGVKEGEEPNVWNCALCKAAKPAGSHSYYKQINNVKYDRALLDQADAAVAGAGDGRVSEKDAQAIWDDAADGSHYTDCEKRTIAYIKANYKCTDKAIALFDKAEKDWAEKH